MTFIVVISVLFLLENGFYHGQKELQLDKVQNAGTFENAIRAFNSMYRMPVGKESWDHTPEFAARPAQFQNILSEEVEESHEILLGADALDHETALCDWLGDLMVYCASEALKYDAFPDLIFAPGRDVLDPLIAGLSEVAQKKAGQDLAMIVRVVDDHARRHLDETSTNPRHLPIAITEVAVAGFAALARGFDGFDYWAILNIIMESNFSKLGPDGKPIYDERGKVLKGPGYWKPEPAIRQYLSQLKRSDS